jgi:hypothetical protein
MALPVSNGQNWITGSFGATQLVLNLPRAEMITYESQMFDYQNCGLPSAYKIELLAGTTSSYASSRNVQYYGLQWYWLTTGHPGLIDRILYDNRDEAQFSITDIVMNFAFTATTSSRQGLFINAQSGSAHLSLEPQAQPSGLLKGDLWFSNSGTLRFLSLKQDGSSSYVAIPLFGRINDTISSSAARFGTSARPIARNVGLGRVLADNWYVTANSPDFTGSGFRNETWGGGMFLPDSGTVSVFGSGMNFLVPSGTLTVYKSIFMSGTITLTNNDINVNTGGSAGDGFIHVTAGSVTAFGRFIMNATSGSTRMPGSGALFIINAGQVGNVRLFSGSIDLSTGSFDGDFYLYQGGGLSGSNLGYARAASAWWTILSSSDYYPVIDAGPY